MTAAAREALQDCKIALEEFVDGVQGRQWWLRWITCVVLLRAVGHVLRNVDGRRDAKLRLAVDNWWSTLNQSKPSPPIFWSLIEEERNAILKEYRTRAGQGVTVHLGGIEVNMRTGEQKADPPGPVLHHYVLNDGPFAGLDQREVLADAIAWWEEQLSAVERAASAA